jgi:cytochrome c oxidase cbb3-type subunit III
MTLRGTKRSILAAINWVALALAGFLAMASAALSAQNSASQIEAQASFDSICASCHGLDARGGERGPDIASRPEVVRKTDAQLAEILKSGKTSAGMPAFSFLDQAKLTGLVAYLRTLQGRGAAVSFPGDATQGKNLFFGKAKCGECHMVGGQGGFFARDLSTYAARLGAEQVGEKIVNPDKDLDPRRGQVTVVLRDSRTIFGALRNEDNFSLQLQTPDGAFHLLNKSDIQLQTYVGKSAMPADFGTTLSQAELNDIVSYLLRASAPQKTSKPGNNSEDRDEN